MLESSGISCYEEFVLHTTLPNVPGALSQLARKLAAKDINIGACYQTTVKGEKKASAVLAVSHRRKALAEPVIGTLKEQRGVRRFRMRGLKKVAVEFALATTALN